ncbi:DEAD/DEAH box helicase [Sphingomicrobium lutaoense]|uniref:DEAD-box ATP-dependent RNA helicase RhpA n=1 Tax=Sphingomicrobium lutaoense TaxID=515949 RepID=A0A839Z179_9SPHN|nr:DEAD/DEAH box helicase [Sphingomicrobium lutaoense]MBB3763335.1 superfamily II DNA/RNA helicase [Sphingomicrobium lutaoense]
MTFADLGLSDELLRAVGDAGYDTPTPIQKGAITPTLMGKDLIGIAQTGTGKTASFVLPMIDILAEGRSRARMPRSLILEPTRELAAQVAENFEKYGKYHPGLSMALLIGGVQMGDQIKQLEKGVDVLIATPGRLLDLFERGKILLNGCDLLVIDEADRMLDMGFIPDIESICQKLPRNRQTLLFSATMPPPIKKLADQFLTDPKTVEVARAASTNENIEQRLVKVSPRDKRSALREILRDESTETAIVFCNKKVTVRELATSLKRSKFRIGQIQGDMDQSNRIAELDRFKSGEINILVASDVAARGLDIKGVSTVVNYDVPWQPDDYVHRIGRTGRAGATGVAYTLATPSDAEAIEAIEKLIGQMIGKTGKTPAGDAADAKDKPAKPKKTDMAEKKPAAKPKKTRAQSEERDEKPRRSREEPPKKKDSPARAREAVDDDWNGPVPSFLSIGV